jgi:hypothetical protein
MHFKLKRKEICRVSLRGFTQTASNSGKVFSLFQDNALLSSVLRQLEQLMCL